MLIHANDIFVASSASVAAMEGNYMYVLFPTCISRAIVHKQLAKEVEVM